MNYVYYPDYLEHHGILGMKWGIRRYQSKDGTWTEKGLEHRRKEGVSLIEKGSSVRRISNVYEKEPQNKLGIYSYGKGSQKEYRQTARWLPSVDPTYSGRMKVAKESQYEFIRDSTLVEGKKAVDDFMNLYGDMKFKDVFKTYKLDKLADQEAMQFYSQSAKDRPNETVLDYYNERKKFDKITSDNSAINFSHGFIHFRVNDITDNSGTTVMQDFVNRYKEQEIDAIVDPEDYSANYMEPILIINKDAVRENRSKRKIVDI